MTFHKTYFSKCVTSNMSHIPLVNPYFRSTAVWSNNLVKMSCKIILTLEWGADGAARSYYLFVCIKKASSSPVVDRCPITDSSVWLCEPILVCVCPRGSHNWFQSKKTNKPLHCAAKCQPGSTCCCFTSKVTFSFNLLSKGKEAIWGPLDSDIG